MFRQLIAIVIISNFFFISIEVQGQEKNSCPTFPDYITLSSNPNCYHNPDVYADTPEIIARHFGHFEVYDIVTEDGYILHTFRIPRNNSKGVILLLHPVSTDSIIWVSFGKNSYAYALWNDGYEVWMPNYRGSYTSQKHVNLTIEDKEYWDYTFHEVGVYDLRAAIKFVRSKTNNVKLTVIADSMGSTSCLAYVSIFAQEAYDSAKVFILMTPTAIMKNWHNILKKYINLVPFFENLFEEMEVYTVGNYYSMFSRMLRSICIDLPLQELCTRSTQLGSGWNMQEFNPELIILAASHLPRGLGVKCALHYVQIVNNGGNFRLYDHGEEKNLKLYNSKNAPDYPIWNISVPLYLMYGSRDSQTDMIDTEELISRLPTGAKIYGNVKLPYNHVDFLVARSIKKKVYDRILRLINKI